MSDPIPKPTVIILCDGGVIHQVLSDLPVTVVFVDADTDGVPVEDRTQLDGEEWYVSNVEVDVDPQELARRLQAIGPLK